MTCENLKARNYIAFPIKTRKQKSFEVVVLT